MNNEPIVPKSVSIPISMLAFFLIFSTVGGLVELLSEGSDGEQSYALFAASASTVIYGLAMSWIGTRLPARWWGGAILVGVIFYLIWLVMNAVSGSLDAEAIGSGLLYAVISALIGGIFFQVLGRDDT
jgi:xanthine/uracil permease